MIELKNIKRYYGKGENLVKAVDDINLAIDDGDVLAVVGKSGSGKTTLLNVMSGLDKPTQGNVLYDDVEIYSQNDGRLSDFRLNNIGFVFQFFDLLPELNVIENITLPSKIAKKKVDKEKLYELLDRLELREKIHNYPSQLSGGQQQRTAIARSLINDPKIIFCDEPTGNLDDATGKEIVKLLFEMNRMLKKTVIIVTHDQEIAKQCDRMIVLSDGKIIS